MGVYNLDKLNKLEILKVILEDVEEELTDEEILHLILDRTVFKDLASKKKYTLGQKAADKLAKFAGSWTFIILFTVALAAWIMINNKLGNKAFDPFPFILLNLILSCTAAIQAPLIMMSQNRQEEKDRQRAENDYKVNLKTEIIIQDIHRKLDILLEEKDKQSE
ncbi:integral membrane protein [Peptoniphilus indolicus ATCC 29427]|uniref:Integral membrane protein n=1 Tax=Peptoniphilus indolicus ATCC 29427 TaxID=997350 RepID=G4D3G5_9FIRM|nr:integral membrane protein [Peptoniphilus indolicus ATCC 29427]